MPSTLPHQPSTFIQINSVMSYYVQNAVHGATSKSEEELGMRLLSRIHSIYLFLLILTLGHFSIDF